MDGQDEQVSNIISHYFHARKDTLQSLVKPPSIASSLKEQKLSLAKSYLNILIIPLRIFSLYIEA